MDKKSTMEMPWMLWLRQVKAIFRLELRKNLLSKRALLLYLLALTPILLLLLIVAIPQAARDLRNPEKAREIFSVFFDMMILRAVTYFGCVWVFMNLFRGEIIDRSLHYYFLAPIRREVLVIGKYLSGLISAMILFGGSALISILVIHKPRGYSAAADSLLSGRGLTEALTYISIVLLGCVGYGAVFMLIGIFFRNPIIPAFIIYWWEIINFLLPPLLKKVSVIHYLHSLNPWPMSEGPFALIGEPTPAYISVPGLVIFTLIVLAIASHQIRKLEIRYGGE